MPIPFRIALLFIVAGLIVIAGLILVRLISHQLRDVRNDRRFLRYTLFGACLGFMFWPVVVSMTLRFSSNWSVWLATGPFPVNHLEDPLILIGVTFLIVTLPWLGFLWLNRRGTPSR